VALPGAGAPAGLPRLLPSGHRQSQFMAQGNLPANSALMTPRSTLQCTPLGESSLLN